MPGRYAAGTEVSSDKSRTEIERTLRRYGATAFAYSWEGNQAQVAFKLGDRHIRFRLPLPHPASEEFTLTPTGRERSAPAAEEAYEQAVRQRWRALALVIKAKLEAVEAGISTVEDEFLAHIALPDGRTVGDWLSPQLAAVYAHNTMPALLPGSTDA
ncbi:MAG TPA: hypothetical protein VFB06_11570 [Streptosporangiaceae bacterium]|nr:hypothetical protein [Streptosporangiaceae bacterium]